MGRYPATPNSRSRAGLTDIALATTTGGRPAASNASLRRTDQPVSPGRLMSSSTMSGRRPDPRARPALPPPSSDRHLVAARPQMRRQEARQRLVVLDRAGRGAPASGSRTARRTRTSTAVLVGAPQRVRGRRRGRRRAAGRSSIDGLAEAEPGDRRRWGAPAGDEVDRAGEQLDLAVDRAADRVATRRRVSFIMPTHRTRPQEGTASGPGARRSRPLKTTSLKAGGDPVADAGFGDDQVGERPRLDPPPRACDGSG